MRLREPEREVEMRRGGEPEEEVEVGLRGVRRQEMPGVTQ